MNRRVAHVAFSPPVRRLFRGANEYTLKTAHDYITNVEFRTFLPFGDKESRHLRDSGYSLAGCMVVS